MPVFNEVSCPQGICCIQILCLLEKGFKIVNPHICCQASCTYLILNDIKDDFKSINAENASIQDLLTFYKKKKNAPPSVKKFTLQKCQRRTIPNAPVWCRTNFAYVPSFCNKPSCSPASIIFPSETTAM